jgi:hypothetical protein
VKSTPLSYVFFALGLLCLVVAALYYFGVLQIAVSNPNEAHHLKHAILFAVLAVASFIAFNFARPKAA